MERKRKEEGHEHLGTCLTHKDRAIRILYHAVAFLTKRVGALEKKATKLKTQGDQNMANTTALEAKVQELKEAADAREARDVLQEQATDAQIQALKDSVAALQAIIDAGSTDPAVQAKIDEAVTKMEAVIVSLNAADPTPPVV